MRFLLEKLNFFVDFFIPLTNISIQITKNNSHQSSKFLHKKITFFESTNDLLNICLKPSIVLSTSIIVFLQQHWLRY